MQEAVGLNENQFNVGKNEINAAKSEKSKIPTATAFTSILSMPGVS